MDPTAQVVAPARSTWQVSMAVSPDARNLEQHSVSSTASSSSSNQELISPTTSQSIPQPPLLAISSGASQSLMSTSLPVSLYPGHLDLTRRSYQGMLPTNSTPLLGNDTSNWFSPVSPDDERPALMPIMVPTPLLETHSPSSLRQASPTSSNAVVPAGSSRHEHPWPIATRVYMQRSNSLPTVANYSSATNLLGWGNSHASPVAAPSPTTNYWGMNGSVSLSYATYGTYPGNFNPHVPQHDSHRRTHSTTDGSDAGNTVSGMRSMVTVPLHMDGSVANGDTFDSPISDSATEMGERSGIGENPESRYRMGVTGPIRTQAHKHHPRQSQPQRQQGSPYPHPFTERTPSMPVRYAVGSYASPASIGRTMPAFYVRRRNTVPVAAMVPTIPDQDASSVPPKRKPLPKIYECSDPSCNKKFDRPSTLKVHEAIHTGAKDFMCEYCSRAFTVASNMKRHARGCKHKALSPPMTVCWFACIAPNAVLLSVTTIHASATLDPPSSVIAASNSRAVSASKSVVKASFPLIAPEPVRREPAHHIMPYPIVAYNPQMTLSATPLPSPVPAVSSPGLQPVIQGQKAPMIIGAMFSAQQNVPNSISHLILVHMECDSPLPPTHVHAKYSHLYQKAGVLPPAVSTFTGVSGESNMGSYIVTTPLTMQNYTSLMVRAVSTPVLEDSAGTERNDSGSDGEGGNKETVKAEGDELVEMDRSMRTSGLLPLPNDLSEDRDSFIPRSRYCYHPAEYNETTVLPGPGLVAIPYEDIEAQAAR